MSNAATHDIGLHAAQTPVSRDAADEATRAPSRWTLRALAVVGVLMIVNGAAFLYALVINAPYAFSENGAQWEYQVFHLVYLVELAILALCVPGLRAFRGGSGRSLPGWLVSTLTALIPLQAGTVFVNAFVVPFLADVAPEALDVSAGGGFAIGMSVVWVLWSVALATLGVIGARRRVIPVAASVLLAVGALIIPVFGPVGTILMGAGLGLWASRALRAETKLLPADADHS